jgi:hypothetical protein
MTLLQRRATRHHESLQRAEARRQVLETMLREREEQLDERDERLRKHEIEFESQRCDHAMALERANKQLSTALASGKGEWRFPEPLYADPRRAAPDEEAGAAAPAAVVAAAAAEPAAADLELQARVGELQEAERKLHEQLRNAQAANLALRDALAAAELMRRDAATNATRGDSITPRAVATATNISPLRRGQRLLVRTDGDSGIVHVLGHRTTIGRIPGNDMRIDSESISRHHAVVLVTDGSTVIEDLNSTNGVLVNDVRVARQELREGDIVTVGKVSFRYVVKPEGDVG